MNVQGRRPNEALQLTKPRIHIIGGPGSGKSFVASELSRRLGVPAYDLDDLFWDRRAARYGVCANPDERDRRLAAIVAQDGWVIEGVYYGWLAPSFDAADVIVELSPSIWVRHWRVMRRFALRKFRCNPSKHESVLDLWRLLRWSHAYDGRHLAEARESISGRGRQVVACTTPEQVFAAASTFGGAKTVSIEIRPVGVKDRPWVSRAVSETFASPRVVSRGVVHIATDLPGFLAEQDGTPIGLLLYDMGSRECEVVVLLSLQERTGVATHLLARAEQVARGAGCRRLWLVTTNDNLSAIAFYQARGWRQVAVRRGAVAEARRLKPEIPEFGTNGLPKEDEIEFELALGDPPPFQ